MPILSNAVLGRYDMVCPMGTAYELKARWPTSELVVIPDAGHSAAEPGIISELINATDKMAKIVTDNGSFLPVPPT